MEITRRQTFLLMGGAAASAVATGRMLGVPGTDAPTRGRGTWTSFGTLAVLGAARSPRPAADAHHAGPAARAAFAPHGWSELVRLEVEVHNGLRRPVLFSPGQLRLRIGGGGPTVTPYDAGRAPGALGALSTTRTWVSYLAPARPGDLTVEFTDAASAAPLVMAVRATGSAPAAPSHSNHEGTES